MRVAPPAKHVRCPFGSSFWFGSISLSSERKGGHEWSWSHVIQGVDKGESEGRRSRSITMASWYIYMHQHILSSRNCVVGVLRRPVADAELQAL